MKSFTEVKFRFTKINLFAPGTDTPESVEHNTVGIWAEDEMVKNGFKLQFGEGPDIPDADLELKTHCLQSRCGVTMGKQSLEKVMDLSYDESAIKRKLQNILYLVHDRNRQVITQRILMDFRHPEIQEQLRLAYEYGRNWLKDNPDKNITPPHGHFAYWEKGVSTFQFRLRPSQIMALDGIARSIKIRNMLFNF